MSWRKQQLHQYYNNKGIMEQDARLIGFVKSHDVTKLCLVGEEDLEYFSERLPGVEIYSNYRTEDSYMLAFIKVAPFFNFEDFINELTSVIARTSPDYLYIAINKFAVTTKQFWPDLTQDYDADLLNILSKALETNYTELERTYREDRGQYFNFVHPTTNIYYERTNSTQN